jgi:hypothetical protein
LFGSNSSIHKPWVDAKTTGKLRFYGSNLNFGVMSHERGKKEEKEYCKQAGKNLQSVL